MIHMPKDFFSEVLLMHREREKRKEREKELS
jgi:hypothetical protein